MSLASVISHISHSITTGLFYEKNRVSICSVTARYKIVNNKDGKILREDVISLCIFCCCILTTQLYTTPLPLTVFLSFAVKSLFRKFQRAEFCNGSG